MKYWKKLSGEVKWIRCIVSFEIAKIQNTNLENKNDASAETNFSVQPKLETTQSIN